MGYLLDTNVWIDIERGREDRLINKAASVSNDDLLLSMVVLGEIVAGIERSRNPELARRTYDILFHGRATVGIDEGCAAAYGSIRARLLDKGTPIGANDLWIAAQAVSNGLVLVTANTAEFSRVPGLVVENWRSG
ncbi:type II toxin-antitoxin system VapC family toxin [uncultured Corynebacterium sp.]|uniref:type II toxin-antitoxin system VapC family toxin n=1 Tax=Corynebacterium sp. HMSC071B10 TaxID=1739494 RepID=UPI0008A204FC|nr:hypothetical protein HMPREF2990_08445 [Corynebacterium sp. HMSC071B10]